MSLENGMVEEKLFEVKDNMLDDVSHKEGYQEEWTELQNNDSRLKPLIKLFGSRSKAKRHSWRQSLVP